MSIGKLCFVNQLGKPAKFLTAECGLYGMCDLFVKNTPEGPLHYTQFLEAAAARILLRRVGGGYSFSHRLLLDYFADLPQEKP